jgi:hypothetical protein
MQNVKMLRLLRRFAPRNDIIYCVGGVLMGTKKRVVLRWLKLEGYFGIM